jgi:hypothetical protein
MAYGDSPADTIRSGPLIVTPLGAPGTNHDTNALPEDAVEGPKSSDAAISTAVAVDTAVLGDVHAEAGVTASMGVPDSTL